MVTPRAARERVQVRSNVMAGSESAGSAFGANSWLVEEMYEQYRADPESVGESWREFFEDYRSMTAAAHPELAQPAVQPAPPESAPQRAGVVAGTRRRRARLARTLARTRIHAGTGSDGRSRRADQGRRRRDRQEHGGQPRRPDRDQLPQRARQAARGQPQGDQRLPLAVGARQGQLHAPHRLRHRAGDRRGGAEHEERLRCQIDRGWRRRQAAARAPRARQHGSRGRRRQGRRHADARRARSSGTPTRSTSPASSPPTKS